jgi:uncharacterized membrane protein YkoI
MKRITFALLVCLAVASASYAAPQAATTPAKSPQSKPTQGAGHETAEKKLSLKNLPPAVRATVEAESKNATVKGLSSEKENGKTVYELETLVNGRTRDLMIDAAGKVYIVEEQLDIDKAPAPVRAALEAKGKIVTLESVQENGNTTYEGQVQPKTGKKITLELDANGKPIKK